MKDGVLDNATVAQMLDDDALEQRGRHAGVPDALGIHDDDRSTGADAEAGRFAAFDATRAEEEPFALQQGGQQPVQLASPMIGRAVPADADENVPGIRVHGGRHDVNSRRPPALQDVKRPLNSNGRDRCAANEGFHRQFPSMQTITVNGVTALHAAAARRTGPAVVFVHGIFVDGRIWAAWLEHFAERGFDAYAVHLRGRAGSRPGTDVGRASMNDFTDDVREILRHTGARVIVGHSMGGLIAQKLAAMGEVDATVLITPAPPRGISVVTPQLALVQIRYLPAILRGKVLHPGREDLRKMVMNRVPAAMQDDLLDRMLPDSGLASREMSIGGVPVDAARVRCPLLVIAGEDDLFIPPRIVERVAKRYGTSVLLAEHHGHMLVVEPGWEQIATRVERWILESSPARV